MGSRGCTRDRYWANNREHISNEYLLSSSNWARYALFWKNIAKLVPALIAPCFAGSIVVSKVNVFRPAFSLLLDLYTL